MSWKGGWQAETKGTLYDGQRFLRRFTTHF